jgi:hypothetical protein
MTNPASAAVQRRARVVLGCAVVLTGLAALQWALAAASDSPSWSVPVLETFAAAMLWFAYSRVKPR